MMRRRVIFSFMALILTGFVLVGCNIGYVYDRYRSVDVNGWNRADTLDFNVGRLPAGEYDLCVGFRATSDYPYKELGFDVDCTVYTKHKTAAGKDSLSFREIHKREKCPVYDDAGRMVGRSGISCDDFSYRFGRLTVGENDSVVVSVTHGMNQEVMPGLMQVGLQLMNRQ